MHECLATHGAELLELNHALLAAKLFYENNLRFHTDITTKIVIRTKLRYDSSQFVYNIKNVFVEFCIKRSRLFVREEASDEILRKNSLK